jgi:hypothetical protein
MASMHIKRISEHTYAVRQYDEILSVDLGEMNENKLHGHLTVRHLMGHTPDGVLDSLLKVGDEVTVQFRTLL